MSASIPPATGSGWRARRGGRSRRPPDRRRQRRGEILLEALDAGFAVSLKTQQRAPRRVAEAAGVVLADHQADDLGQIDVDVHQDIALDVEAHL